MNREGSELLKQLFRFAARYSGTHLSVFAGRAWARLSCTLQSAVAQAVLNRDPGVDLAGPVSSEEAPPVMQIVLTSSEEAPLPSVQVASASGPDPAVIDAIGVDPLPFPVPSSLPSSTLATPALSPPVRSRPVLPFPYCFSY